MRPIKLTMQAFGPYVEKQVLAFDELGETGIYAIIGETGAGKTTIFDAIVFALYGTGSGEDRGRSQTLRSLSAPPDLETKVELEFVSRGRTYTVTRRPRQQLAKLRGEGLRDVPASQALTLPDGTVLTSESDVSDKIEKDILGVTKEQFCQIVMIAQGEFRKLLRASSDERRAILQTIFKTAHFEALTRNIKKASDDKLSELDKSRNAFLFYLKEISLPADDELHDELRAFQQADAKSLYVEGSVDCVARIAASVAGQHAAAAAYLRSAEAARNAAKTNYDRAVEFDEKRAALNRQNAELSRLGAELTAAEETLAAAEARRPEIAQLTTAIDRDEQKLPDYAKLDALRDEEARLRRSFAASEGARGSAEKALEQIGNQVGALTQEEETLADAADRLLAARDGYNAVTARGQKLQALQARVLERQAAAEALSKAEKALLDSGREEADAAGRLDTLREELNFIGNAALQVAQLKAREADLLKARDELDGHVRQLHDYTAAKADCEQTRRRYLDAELESDRLEQEAERLRKLYNHNIAGILAQKLTENSPCPVCGSVHHPSPAVLPDDSVTEEAVKLAEADAKDAKNKRDELALRCSSLQSGCDEKRKPLAAKFPEIPEEEWAAEADRLLRANAGEADALSAELQRAQKQAQRAQELSETLIPAALQAVQNAVSAKSAASGSFTSRKAVLEQAEREVAAAAEGVMPEGWIGEDLARAAERNGEETRLWEARGQKARQDRNRLTQIAEEKTKLAQQQTGQTENLRLAEQELARLSAALEHAQKDVEDLRNRLPYPARADCERAIQEKSRQKKTLEEAIVNSQNTVSGLQQKISALRGAVDTLAQQLKSAPAESTEALRGLFDEKQAAFEAADLAEREIGQRKSRIGSAKDNMDSLAESIRVLDREYRMMKDVADTVSGNVTGQAKIPLETFVQATYFDRIIDFANLRLRHISRGQYDLVRRKTEDSGKHGKTGLDLDVIDHHNGMRRPVSTLSGGEGFLASLSFALGMSDAIQAAATSAVQLETMFVDEGFGSLSESFLTLVMDELQDTANIGHRLIGIISHVSDVKEGVDRCIEVVKAPDGTSTAEIK